MRRALLFALAAASCTFQGDPPGPRSSRLELCDGVRCAPSGPCRAAGSCDPATGLCSDPHAPDGTSCEDGDLCTTGDRCESGACSSGEPLDCEASRCVVGACDPASGLCIGTPIPDGTPCDDRSVCTTADGCFGGGCTGDPLPCESTDSCVVASCDPELGCSMEVLPDASPCDDGNACTEEESCTGGVCGGGSSVVCLEPDDCHLPGTCDPTSGCAHPIRPDGVACNDGDLCTFGDTCTAGVCDGTPLVCTASNDCHFGGSCDPATGVCSTVVRPDGAGCDDGSQCTQVDVCAGGDCLGTDPIVFDGALCEDGLCFTDVALQAGITWTSTASGTVMIGGGSGFLDYDLDGWLDVIVGSESGRASLFRNLGGGGFEDVTLQADLPLFFLPDRFMGFAIADYDDDGDPDIYLLARGPNKLMRNEGDGTFTDVTTTAGVGDPSWSTAAAFGDYDADGDLDLYVGNYIMVSSFPNHTPFPNKLYRNEGDGTFTEVAAQLGLAGAGTTLAVTWSDHDGDRDLDLFVCNDFGSTIEPNRLYRNDAGAFTEVSAQLGADLQIYCMGITAGDYDRDGDLDYYFTNIDRNVLLENRGAAGFADVAVASGTDLEWDRCYTALYSTSWGAGFHDFDADGFVDLYVSTGYIPATSYIANALATPNALYANDHQGAFFDVSETGGIDDLRIGRGVAFGDYDRDGDVDILQVNLAGSPHLYRNDSPAPGSQLRVEVTGRASARDAIGTRLIADAGSVTHVREVNPNYSFESSSEKAVHFGLGAATSVDRLRILYPSGIDQTLFDVPAGMTIAVIEPRIVIEQTTVSPASSPPGGDVDLSFTLRNLSALPEEAEWSVRIGSQSGPNGITSLGPNGSRVISVPLTAPGPSGTVPLFVTIGDGDGAVDQSRASLAVQ